MCLSANEMENYPRADWKHCPLHQDARRLLRPDQNRQEAFAATSGRDTEQTTMQLCMQTCECGCSFWHGILRYDRCCPVSPVLPTLQSIRCTDEKCSNHAAVFEGISSEDMAIDPWLHPARLPQQNGRDTRLLTNLPILVALIAAPDSGITYPIFGRLLNGNFPTWSTTMLTYETRCPMLCSMFLLSMCCLSGSTLPRW